MSIQLREDEQGEWRIISDAESYEWRLETRYPPRINFAHPNIGEIQAYREALLAKFPAHMEQVGEIVDPLLASASAALGAVFTATVDATSPHFRPGYYAVTFTYENRSDYTVEHLKVAIVIRNEAGQIIEHEDLQVFYSGSLPQGVKPGEQLSPAGQRYRRSQERNTPGHCKS